MESTQATRERYWRHWKNFLPTSIDPYLQNLDAPERILVIQAFARRVREGVFGRGRQIKAGSVQTAIGSVAKTIELAGCPNPIHRPGTTNYHVAIALQIEAYRRNDPAVSKQAAVPIAIPDHIYQSTRTTMDRRQKATGELALIAFFFLLRVGEYTYHGKTIRRTQQFRLKDLKFFAHDHEIPLTHLKARASEIDLVSMTIDNQKNGKSCLTMPSPTQSIMDAPLVPSWSGHSTC